MSEDKLVCSFCSKSRKDVTKMIVGTTKVAICNECIKLCVEILDEDVVKTKAEQFAKGDKDILNPVNIKEYLDQYVIGQDAAKTVLSVAVSNHYKRTTSPVISIVSTPLFFISWASNWNGNNTLSKMFFNPLAFVPSALAFLAIISLASLLNVN